jgi:hypothetical protein
MGAFKQLAIELESVRLGDIGVLLADESRPAGLWRIESIYLNAGELELSRLNTRPGLAILESVRVSIEDFWPLV